MQVNIYSSDGKATKKTELPKSFNEEFRPDLIRKVVKAIQSNRRQRYGASPLAGKRHSTDTAGKGRGVSRVQRLKDGTMRGAFIPGTVGGRRAHPPKAEKNFFQKINKKENKKARRSALSSIANKELVKKRGHKFDEKLTLPIIIEDKFKDTEKTKDVIATFEKLGIYEDILRAENGKKIRAGKGKMRNRRYKIPKSLLVVIADECKLQNSAENLVGVDVVFAKNLNAEFLAPGGDAGRLTLFTESALKLMEKW